MEHMRARARAVIIGFGRRVREHRLTAGMTQAELGRRSRVSLDFISHIERGTSNPSLETMVLVACALDCSVVDLLTPQNAEPHVTLGADAVRQAQEALDALRCVLSRVPVGPERRVDPLAYKANAANRRR
jgi:transcriptional regulator with XRE-family HTH domain